MYLISLVPQLLLPLPNFLFPQLHQLPSPTLPLVFQRKTYLATIASRVVYEGLVIQMGPVFNREVAWKADVRSI